MLSNIAYFPLNWNCSITRNFQVTRSLVWYVGAGNTRGVNDKNILPYQGFFLQDTHNRLHPAKMCSTTGIAFILLSEYRLCFDQLIYWLSQASSPRRFDLCKYIYLVALNFLRVRITFCDFCGFSTIRKKKFPQMKGRLNFSPRDEIIHKNINCSTVEPLLNGRPPLSSIGRPMVKVPVRAFLLFLPLLSGQYPFPRGWPFNNGWTVDSCCCHVFKISFSFRKKTMKWRTKRSELFKIRFTAKNGVKVLQWGERLQFRKNRMKFW